MKQNLFVGPGVRRCAADRLAADPPAHAERVPPTRRRGRWSARRCRCSAPSSGRCRRESTLDDALVRRLRVPAPTRLDMITGDSRAARSPRAAPARHRDRHRRGVHPGRCPRPPAADLAAGPDPRGGGRPRGHRRRAGAAARRELLAAVPVRASCPDLVLCTALLLAVRGLRRPSGAGPGRRGGRGVRARDGHLDRGRDRGPRRLGRDRVRSRARRTRRSPATRSWSTAGAPRSCSPAACQSPYEHLWSLPMRTLDPDLTELQALLSGPNAPPGS